MELITGKLIAPVEKMLVLKSDRRQLLVPCPGLVRTDELIGGRPFRMSELGDLPLYARGAIFLTR